MRTVLLLLAVGALAVGALAGCRPDEAAYRAEIEAFREGRLARLREPGGWLALTGLYWLEDGAHAFGADSANALVFPPGAPPRIGTFTVADSVVTMRVAPGVGVTVGDSAATEVVMVDDVDGEPTVARLGSMSWEVIRRSHGLGVRLRDAAAPLLTTFEGIDAYAADPRWRLPARFEPYDPPRRVRIPSITGTDEPDTSPGAVVFELDGETHRLDVTGQPGDSAYFVVFGDATNSHETYGGGRFLYVAAPDAEGATVVDFNRAYNPPCVFTPYATCPLPPPQNRLPAHVEAGEKTYGDAAHG
jgi:uncharacterized protein (DUF1684 family)